MTVPGLGQLATPPWLQQRTHERCTACASSQRVTTAVAFELSGRVSVTTAEGDRVTLSASWGESLQAATYSGTAQGGGVEARFQQALAGYRSRRDLGLIVEGDLSEEEVRDLTALFRTVGAIFEEFYGGQDEEGLARTTAFAEDFGAWSSLSTLDLDLHVQRSVTVATAGQSVIDSAAPSGRFDTPGVASQAQTAIPSSSLGTTAPTQFVTAGLEERSDALAEQLLHAVEAGRLHRHRLRRFLERLLERADRQAKDGTASDDERPAIAERAREKALERANEPAESARAVAASFSYRKTVVHQSQYAVLT